MIPPLFILMDSLLVSEKIYIMNVAINIKISRTIVQRMSEGVDAALVEKHPQFISKPLIYA